MQRVNRRFRSFVSLFGIDVVEKLVKAGADLEKRDLEGQTTLFKASDSICTSHHISSRFDGLVKLGARLDTRDNKGRILFHRVVQFPDRLEYFTPLMQFDPSIGDNKGNMLFHEAMSKRQRERRTPIFIHLKKLGVNIDQPNYRGKAVLHKVCARLAHNNSGCRLEPHFEYIIRECHNVDPRDADGVRPLHTAAAVSEYYVFRLINAGARIMEVTNEDMTVLHIAARARKPGVIGLVLSRLSDLDDAAYKAFVNRKNAGNTALHYACCSDRVESVRLLLNARANPDVLGKYGRTPSTSLCWV